MVDCKKLLGKRIKELRKCRELTQEQLAELVAIETGSLSAIESGRHYPSLATVEKISQALNFEIRKFFNFNNLKSNEEKILFIRDSLARLSPDMVNTIYTLIDK